MAVLLVASAIAFTSTGCGNMIDPGHVGIKVNRYGTNKGVSDYPAVTGMVWYNPFTTSVFEYPTFVQTAVWTKDPTEGSTNNEEITFNSQEGLVISGDISLSYCLVPEKVPHFYVKFRSDDLTAFTHGFLRNVARDAANEIGSKYKVEEVYGAKKEEFIQAVKDRINSQVDPIGIKLEQFGFIGAPRLPQPVIDSLNAKIQATQNAIRVENEIRQEQAEAQKKIVKATADAQANRLLSESVTPTLIQWKQLEIQMAAITKWNGQRPMVEGSGAGLLLSIPMPQQK